MEHPCCVPAPQAAIEGGSSRHGSAAATLDAEPAGRGHPPRPPPHPQPRHPGGQLGPDKARRNGTPGGDGTDHGRPDDEDDPGVELSIELLAPVVYEQAAPSWLSRRAGAAAGRFARFGSALVAIAVGNPLETIAVLVLGIGAAIYPPIWLVGALIVVISRKLDLRDKWFGLAMPVLVVIFGSPLSISLPPHQPTAASYPREPHLPPTRLSPL